MILIRCKLNRHWGKVCGAFRLVNKHVNDCFSWWGEGKQVALLNCLPDVLWLSVFCAFSSRCLRLVCSVRFGHTHLHFFMYKARFIFIIWFTNPPTVIFRKVDFFVISIICILSADSKYYLFCSKNNIFLRFCLCIFEIDTVKTECPVQIFRKMMKYLKI